jgi:hypothetical protein
VATNPYFKYDVRSEKSLYEDLVIEALKMYGQDVYYLPREIVNQDSIFLDDVPSRFSTSYVVEMYIENTTGFDGEGDLFTRFGVELRDQATFVVSRKRWQNLIGSHLTEKNFRPREGDLIFLPLSKSIFEIRKVETETPFYQISDLPTFRMQCELFEYSDEDFDTDVVDIDTVEKEAAFQYVLEADSSGAGASGATSKFIVGEQVYQNYDSYEMEGEIVRFSDSDNKVYVAHAGASDGLFHNFTTNKLLIGRTSGAKSSLSLVSQLQAIQETAQNTTFDNFEADFLDFSESNPFGDIS